MINRIALLLSILFFAFGCKTTQTAQETVLEGGTIDVENRDLDTLFVSAPKPNDLKSPEDFKLPKYNASHKLENDILHTVLDLKFDWVKEHVLGKATLTVKPWFYPVDRLVLDAKGFDIHQVNYAGQNTPLKYDYDNETLTIHLGKTIKRGATYDIFIDYTAKPAELGGQGGSAAITSDQGLFFINPRGEDGDKPQQIWTQGETEWNSRWFPTVDKPNERCTQEMFITVQDKFATLSNGLLVESKKNADGTRTDHYKMNQPHAPYLFMLAVGEFAVVKEKWENIPQEYYVEPAYEASAKNIFNYTPEMLAFFSDLTNVKYPWDKYSQVVVRDYVSGAMENTTGVIFGEFVQKHNRELIDNHNDAIVAHEMAHHWFGDYVTCESWANLTMNEGFANYSEYLWFEHQYGRDEADRHRRNEIGGYMGSVGSGGAHPLIHFGYDDKEDMFDAHSYNKGGMVLHMLRHLVGDEAFFASLEKYLKDNALTAVEAHDLRLAFEEVTGQDLKWFFDQWFFESGHPQLKVTYDYQPQKVNVTIEQTQNPDEFPAIFILPFAIDVYDAAGKATRHQVVMDKRIQTFSFDTNGDVGFVNIDAEDILLAEIEDPKSEADFIFQFHHAPLYIDRFEALNALAESEQEGTMAVFEKALDDPFWEIRGLALQRADMTKPAIVQKVADMAEKDPSSNVRSAAITVLAATGDAQYENLLEKVINNEQAYPPIAAALTGLSDVNKTKALAIAQQMEAEDHSEIRVAVGEAYSKAGAIDKRSFFESNWNDLDIYPTFAFFESYFRLLKQADDYTIIDGLNKLNAYATNYDFSPYKRFGAIKAIADMRSYFLDKEEKEKAEPVTIMLNRIKEQEKHEELRQVIRERF